MKEYRVMAYFKADAPKGYQPRSYQRKIVTTPYEALDLLDEAKEYYSRYKYLDKIVIESRFVSRWEEMV